MTARFSHNQGTTRGHRPRLQKKGIPNLHRGCLTSLRYGLSVFHPSGYLVFASSLETAGTMITSSPSFQFAGVATLWFAVSWMESTTRRISSKFLPVVIG